MRSAEFATGQERPGLSDHDKQVLDFAGDLDGHSPDEIHSQFGYGPSTYYGKLNDLLANPDAAMYSPNVVAKYRKAFGHDTP